MKKILSSFITAIIIFSGMHIMPNRVMAKEMETAPKHCSKCSEESRKTDCLPPMPDVRIHGESLKDSLLLGNDCDCTFEKTDKNHHTGILPTNDYQLKQKTFSATLPQLTESMIEGQTFLTAQKINAPPTSYINARKAIQRLE